MGAQRLAVDRNSGSSGSAWTMLPRRRPGRRHHGLEVTKSTSNEGHAQPRIYDVGLTDFKIRMCRKRAQGSLGCPAENPRTNWLPRLRAPGVQAAPTISPTRSNPASSKEIGGSRIASHPQIQFGQDPAAPARVSRPAAQYCPRRRRSPPLQSATGAGPTARGLSPLGGQEGTPAPPAMRNLHPGVQVPVHDDAGAGRAGLARSAPTPPSSFDQQAGIGLKKGVKGVHHRAGSSDVDFIPGQQAAFSGLGQDSSPGCKSPGKAAPGYGQAI